MDVGGRATTKWNNPSPQLVAKQRPHSVVSENPSSSEVTMPTRSKLTEATCHAARLPVRRADPREKKKDLWARAGSWSFSAPGLPRFPHPSHTTKHSNGASGRETSLPPVLLLLLLRPVPLLLSTRRRWRWREKGKSANRGPRPCTPYTFGGQGNRRHVAGNLACCWTRRTFIFLCGHRLIQRIPGTFVGACVSRVSDPGPLSRLKRKDVELKKRKHQDHVADSGLVSTTHYNLVHTPIPIPQVRTIPDAKPTVEKFMGESYGSFQLGMKQK